MNSKFESPKFNSKEIELRLENNEVCIYATNKGLEKLINYCKTLINNPSIGHVHLEDYDVLTQESLKGNIAIFEK